MEIYSNIDNSIEVPESTSSGYPFRSKGLNIESNAMAVYLSSRLKRSSTKGINPMDVIPTISQKIFKDPIPLKLMSKKEREALLKKHFPNGLSPDINF